MNIMNTIKYKANYGDFITDFEIILVKFVGFESSVQQKFVGLYEKRYQRWISKAHGKTLLEASLNKFLSQIGICFSFRQAKIERVYIKTSKNKASESHLLDNVDKLENDMRISLELENYFVDSIESLPNELTFQHLERLHKPTFNSSISSPVGRALLTIASKLYLKYSMCGILCRAPSIEEFPSFTLLQPKTLSTTICLKSKYEEFHFTGYYVPPGIKASIDLLEGNSSGWEVRIGAHTDQLANVNLKRWPCISSNFRLRKKLSITTAFGGLIYLQSPKGNSSIKVKLDSVVEAPFYDLTKPETISNWSQNQQSSSPWAELSGKHVSFCVPSNCIRKLRDPSEVLDIWDKIIESNHELRGTNVNNTWRERVVVDIQPSGGLIHAGYPIVLFYSYSSVLFNKSKIKSSCWSLAHEFGHNFQRACWVPDGTIEALANLFSYHTYQIVFDQKAWTKFLTEKHNESKLLDFALKGFPRDEWMNNCNLPLYLYMQLQKSFGWNSFRMLFREYEIIFNSKELFKSDIDKWNEFIVRFSNIVGLNVVPLFIFWGIQFSEKINSSLSDLTPWLPNDEITRFLPDRVKFCRAQFNFMLYGNESLYSTFQSD
ncbi:TRPM8 channel-associated factor 2 [Brachionus plicatilis]|uniref:TRPM8 channel-associated factor 2 n=1 Tax=Brachionus plicatilis TaxID=10195 RepID=A0A3M7SW09_BRAPC|nr:TRPM8 channel-associated factor 2 [Brachionus plicatilis]